MKRHLLVFAALTQMTLFSHAEPHKAMQERPEVQIGDKWKYSVVDQVARTSVQNEITVKKISDDQIDVDILETSDKGERKLKLKRSRSMNPMGRVTGAKTETTGDKSGENEAAEDDSAEGSKSALREFVRVKFPLYVGAKWDFKYQRPIGETTYNVEVLDFEKEITVRGKKYKAYKIELNSSWMTPSGASSSKQTAYYSPEVKNFIKVETWNYNKTRNTAHKTEELIEHTLGQTTAPPAASTGAAGKPAGNAEPVAAEVTSSYK